MSRTPKRPEEIFDEFTSDLKKVFQDDLISITLYGSGARGDYVPGKSDINFLVIVSEAGMEKLELCFELVKKWKKRNVSVPLFMTKSFIESSLDTYPVEFLNMKHEHVTIFGEDPLINLEFDKDHILLQCEKELKGKTLNLWQEFLKTEGKEEKLFELVRRSLTAYVSLFRALLYAHGKDLPKKKRGVIEACSRELGAKLDTFMKFADMIDGKIKIPKSEMKSMFREYLREARDICHIVDRLRSSI